MIHCAIYLERKRWKLSVYILENCGEGKDMADELADIGCKGYDLSEALRIVNQCDLNVGMTYSNLDKRCSLIMVGLQEDKSQFCNTIDHEKHHAVSHICKRDKIDMHTEEAAYIAGDVGEAMHEMLKKYGL